MKLLQTILIIILLGITVSAHAEDPDIRADLLTAKVLPLLKAEKMAEALPYLAEIESMEPSLSKPLSEGFHFSYIDALDKTGNKTKALSRATKYLKKYGKSGKHYEKVIQITSRLQEQVEIAEREEAARRAREERARAEEKEREDMARAEAANEAARQLRAAEAGDMRAMFTISEYYEAGKGVKKDLAKARYWRSKGEEAYSQDLLHAANGGNADAMEKIAARYDAGLGVKKNATQARSWRERAAETRQKMQAEKRERERKFEISQVDYLENIGKQYRFGRKGPIEFTSSWVGLPFATLTDIINGPTKTTAVQKLKSEATLRPSTWGSPDSMIARAYRKHESEGTMAADAGSFEGQ